MSALNILLRSAAEFGDTKAMQSYLDDGANPNSKDFDGMTALHQACAKAQLDAVRLLLKSGANPNAQTDDGTSPLHMAARFKGDIQSQENALDIARELIAAGADINHRDDARTGETAIHIACRVTNIDLFKLLLERGIDTSIKDGSKRTVFELTEYKIIEQMLSTEQAQKTLESQFEDPSQPTGASKTRTRLSL